MKKISVIVVLMIALIATNEAVAQRHIKGIQSTDIMGGITGNGYYAELGYLRCLSKEISISVPIRGELAKIENIGLMSISLNPAVNYNLWSPTEWLFFSAKGGLSVYYDMLNKSDFEKYDGRLYRNSDSYINYGIFGGAEIETYFSNKIVWVVNFRQNYNFNSPNGGSVYYLGTGFRYNIF